MTTGMTGFSEQGDWDFAAGSVFGFRQWQLKIGLDDTPSALIGSWDYTWLPGTNLAACRPFTNPEKPCDADRIPVQACGCGFWAYWESAAPTWGIGATRKATEEYRASQRDVFEAIDSGGSVSDAMAAQLTTAYRNCPLSYVTITMHGVIEGFGRTIIGEKGFRSQKARVTELTVPGPYERPASRNIAAELKALTGMEVEELTRKYLSEILPEVTFESSFEELQARYQKAGE